MIRDMQMTSRTRYSSKLYSRLVWNGDTNTFASLFTHGELSDVTLKCRWRTWKLHKLILSARCRFFASLFKGAFKVSVS